MKKKNIFSSSDNATSQELQISEFFKYIPGFIKYTINIYFFCISLLSSRLLRHPLLTDNNKTSIVSRGQQSKIYHTILMKVKLNILIYDIEILATTSEFATKTHQPTKGTQCLLRN